MNHLISRRIVYIASLVLISISSAFQNGGTIKYFAPATLSLKPDHIKSFYVDFQDSTLLDTLFQIRSKEGYPISYFRKIKTGVCIDNTCRLLNIVLYWNITGRYLGFELPEGEFLSKTEHEPFQPKEYQRLHEILADPMSPIANFTYNQLVSKPEDKMAGADAITSPTPPAVLEHVVQGAVYTTYRLWHFIYGTTQREILNLTKEVLSPGLILIILNSPDESDKMWALKHIQGYMAQVPELRQRVVGFISDDNYSLAERAINSINSSDLQDVSLQLLLLDKFYLTNYSLRKLIIDKMKETPALAPQVTIHLASNLHTLNGEILSRVLELLKQHNVSDSDSLHKISALLRHENKFISKKAYEYLRNMEVKNNEVRNLMSRYRSEHGI
jgi:hypothetical protein